MLFFITPTQPFESVVDCNNAAGDFSGEMLLDFLKGCIGAMLYKLIEFFELFASEGRFSTLILRMWGDRTFQFSTLPDLLYPSNRNVEALSNLFEGVFSGIIGSHNTFS